MNDELLEWKKAKELCEDLKTGSLIEKIENINASEHTERIKLKAIDLLKKMQEDFNLIEKQKFEDLLTKQQKKHNLVGKKIDDYHLVKLLGAGGMSTVYTAERSSTEIQKKVALKILSPFANDDKYLELFNREQKSLAQLNHNNIVSFHHGGQTEDGTKYLVMDYIENAKDILTYTKDHNLNNHECIKLIMDIAKAMSYAHSKNIIHRDLKSANILIDANGQVKIVDFGISLFADTDQTVSGISTRCFTLDIASPEQIQGKKIDARTDIFSLGALLLQLLTDKAPLPKVNISEYKPIEDKKYIEAILKSSDFNQDLKNIIHTAMHIDIEKRYQDMSCFYQDLERFINHRPVLASSDSKWYRLKKFLQRNATVSALSFGFILVILVGLILISNYSSKSQESAKKNQRSLAIIDALFEQADPFKSKQNTADLVATLERITESQKHILDNDPEFKYHFYNKLAKVYDSTSHYQQALNSKKIALSALTEFANPDDKRYLIVEVFIMNLLHAVERYQESIDMALTFIEKLDTLNDAPPELRLDSYHLLSKSYAALGEYELAHAIGKKAQAHMQQYPNIEPAAVAAMINSMAVVHRNTGKIEEAGHYYKQSIDILKNMEGREKMYSATLVNYAILNGRAGDYQTSEKYFLEALKIIRSVDPNHPNIASIYQSYSTLLSITNRIDEAEEVILKGLNVFKQLEMNKGITNSYDKLTNFALRKSELNKAISYIITNTPQMHEFYQLGHPNLLYHYNLILWILIAEPYKQYGKQVLDMLSEQSFKNSEHSNFYHYYQIQKAYINQKVVDDPEFSTIFDYLFNVSKLSNIEQLSWLNQRLSSDQQLSDDTKAFLSIWKASLSGDQMLYDQYCQKDISWLQSLRFGFKLHPLKACIKMVGKYKFTPSEQLLTIYNNINTDIANNRANIELMVEQLKKYLQKK